MKLEDVITFKGTSGRYYTVGTKDGAIIGISANFVTPPDLSITAIMLRFAVYTEGLSVPDMKHFTARESVMYQIGESMFAGARLNKLVIPVLAGTIPNAFRLIQMLEDNGTTGKLAEWIKEQLVAEGFKPLEEDLLPRVDAALKHLKSMPLSPLVIDLKPLAEMPIQAPATNANVAPVDVLANDLLEMPKDTDEGTATELGQF